MKILAIESSSLVASAAIVEDDILVAEYTVDYKVTHSQTLLPMIDEILSCFGRSRFVHGTQNRLCNRKRTWDGT